jgi:hypothetical protein
MPLEVARAFGDGHQFVGDFNTDTGFVGDDLGFNIVCFKSFIE